MHHWGLIVPFDANEVLNGSVEVVVVGLGASSLILPEKHLELIKSTYLTVYNQAH
jgi:hypothetical protein